MARMPAGNGWSAGVGYCSEDTCVFWEECGYECRCSNTDRRVGSKHFVHRIKMFAKRAGVVHTAR